MKIGRFLLGAIGVALLTVGNARAGDGAARVIVYDGVETAVSPAPPELASAGREGVQSFWITSADLTRATGYEIKPQGVCHEEICYPIPNSLKDALLKKQGAATWFNLAEFARMIRQPFAADEKHQVWYFGERLQAQNEFVNSTEAPNFTLPDLEGKMHSLSDFRGKKVLLITWASW